MKNIAKRIYLPSKTDYFFLKDAGYHQLWFWDRNLGRVKISSNKTLYGMLQKYKLTQFYNYLKYGSTQLMPYPSLSFETDKYYYHIDNGVFCDPIVRISKKAGKNKVLTSFTNSTNDLLKEAKTLDNRGKFLLLSLGVVSKSRLKVSMSEAKETITKYFKKD